MANGIICQKCGGSAERVDDTKRKAERVDRYRQCMCGGRIATVEVPKGHYQNLVRLANSLRQNG